MKWRVPRLLLLLLLLPAFGLARAQPCEMRVRWNDDPPFSMRAADGSIVGIGVEQAQQALQRLGCNARLVEMPWARALAELEAGRLDLLPGTLRTPERERFARFSTPRSQSQNALFVPVESLKAWPLAQHSKLAELRGTGFRLGVQIGVAYGAEYEALMQDPQFARQVQPVSVRRNLWLMAAAGRLDGVLASEPTGRIELRQLGLEQRIVHSGLVVQHAPASTAFSRKSVGADFVERYDQAMRAMQKDGTLDAILQKYGAAP